MELILVQVSEVPSYWESTVLNRTGKEQGAKKVSFTACHSGKL